MFGEVNARLWGVSYLQVAFSGLFSVYHLVIMTYAGAFFYRSISARDTHTDSDQTAFYSIQDDFYAGFTDN